MFNKNITKREYKDFVVALSNKNDLIVLLLEKIARCISITVLNFFGILVIFLPGFSTSSYEVKYACATVMTSFMFGLVFTALARPINICYALKNPEKYKKMVRKKLGRLPDEAGVSTPIP